MTAKPLNRREFLKLAALFGVGSGLAACAPKATTEAPKEATEAPTPVAEEPTKVPEIEPTEAPVEAPPVVEKVTVTIWGWWADRMKYFQDAGDRFTAKNPNIKVEVISFDQDFATKVYASVPAGTGPTLCKMITANYFKMREEGMLIELDPVDFPDSWLKEKYPSHFWDGYGRYVMPEGIQTVLFTYNKAMFAEAGLDPEKPPKTWDEFWYVTQKLTKTDDKGTLTVEGYAVDDWLPFHNPLYQLGGNIVKREGDQLIATFKSPEMEQAIQFFVDAAQKYKVWDRAFPYFTDAIGNQQAATSISEAWGYGVWKSDFPEVFANLGFDVPPTPTGEAKPYYGRKNSVLGLARLINRPDNETEAGRQFQNYLYHEDLDALLGLSLISGLVPVHTDLLKRPEVVEDPFYSLGVKLAPLCYDMVEISDPYSNLCYTLMDKLFVDNLSIQEVMDFAQAELQSMIDNGDVKFMF